MKGAQLKPTENTEGRFGVGEYLQKTSEGLDDYESPVDHRPAESNHQTEPKPS